MDITYSGHCLINHVGTEAELAKFDCAVCKEFLEILRIYTNFEYKRSQVYNETYIRHGFICEYGHEFYVPNIHAATGTCPICDVIAHVHQIHCEEIVTAKPRKIDNNIDARSRKKKVESIIPTEYASATASSIDHTSPASYKTTMALIEKTYTDVNPHMFDKSPACRHTKRINTFIGADQLETDFEYIAGIAYDKESLIKWKCNRSRHNPYCTNRKCMLLTAMGSGAISRDESCNDLVSCGQVFVAPIEAMLKQKTAIECDIDHHIKVKSLLYDACRVFETIFGSDFIDQYDTDSGVDNSFRFDGYCPEYKIGFKVAPLHSGFPKYCVTKGISLCILNKAAVGMDQCIIHVVDWIYNVKLNHNKKFLNTNALVCNMDKMQFLELVRRLLHIYNRRHVWM
jgi:hypothetical protein